MSYVKYLGHASFEIELEGKVVYTDPWWDRQPRKEERLVAPAMTPEQARRADLILISHEHFDHCDPFDVARLQEKTFAQVIAPEPSLAMLEKVPPRSKMTAYSGDSFSTMGVDVTVTDAKHPQSQYPVGYVAKVGDKSIYFAGDTYEFFEMNKIQADVALLPIGGTYTMDVYSAVKALKFMRCKYVVPMHYNTFSNIKADTHEFAKKVADNTRTKAVVLEVGETFSF